MRSIFKALLSIALVIPVTGIAQIKNTKSKSTTTQVAKFKPPVVTTKLGRNKDTATVTLEEAVQLASLPIKVSNSKDIAYPVTSFGFVYRRKGQVENETTGRKEVKYTTVGDVFYATPLPEVWKTNIARTLQKDEELYFYDILVKDPQGRPFYAPPLLIRVK